MNLYPRISCLKGIFFPFILSSLPPSLGLQPHTRITMRFLLLRYLFIVMLLDFALTTVIIHKIKYTEIDWIAYMEEVSTFLSGERDYMLIRGGTGPLVYPAGFVYVFSVLRWIVGEDYGREEAIYWMQWVWCGFYFATLSTVYRLFVDGFLGSGRIGCEIEVGDLLPFLCKKGSRRILKWKTPNTLLLLLLIPLLSLSKRIHSIFVLRLFNDPLAILFAYLSILLFTRGWYKLGCLFYSLGVSIKMNVFLFAPGVLLVLLQVRGTLPSALI